MRYFSVVLAALLLFACAPKREEVDVETALSRGIDTANAVCSTKYGLRPFNPVVSRVVRTDSSWVVRAGISPGDGNAYYARIETRLTGEPIRSLVDKMVDSADAGYMPEVGEAAYTPDSLVEKLHPAIQAGIPEHYRFFMRRIYPPGPVMDSVVIREDTCTYAARTGAYTYLYRTTAPSPALLDSIASLFGRVRPGSYVAPRRRRNVVSWMCTEGKQITCANCLWGGQEHVPLMRELERMIESVFWTDSTLTYEVVAREEG